MPVRTRSGPIARVRKPRIVKQLRRRLRQVPGPVIRPAVFSNTS